MTPAAWIGLRIQEARETKGLTQEEVAVIVRMQGFTTWSRSSIAALETGRRDLSVSELLVMPWVMAALGQPCSLEELLDADVSLRLNDDVTVLPHRVSQVIRKPEPRTDGFAFTDAERRLAWKLEVWPAIIVGQSRKLWDGRRLAEERDRRLAQVEGSDELDKNSRQAKRGHITRELIAELEASLTGRSKRQKKVV